MTSGLRFAMALLAALILVPIGARSATAAQSSGHVYLLRGLANVFSLGMDSLADKLNARGIEATVHEYGQWPSLAAQASAESRANGGAPIIIVGHSLGADAAIEMAERLTALGTPASLVFTFDPVGVTSVGPARGRFINYYQSNNGYGKRLTQGAGFRGSLSNRNLDSVGSLDHFNIEKSPGLHAEVIASIQSVARKASAPERKRVVRSKPQPSKKPETETAAAKPDTEAKPEAKPEAGSKPDGNGGSAPAASSSSGSSASVSAAAAAKPM